MSEVAKQWWPSTIYTAPEGTIEPLHITWINKSGDTDPYVTVTVADTLQYSYDNANWVNASSANISGSQIDGSSQYHVYIRRRPDLAPTTALFSSDSANNRWTINGGKARISGNIMSLLGQDEEVGTSAFAFLFYLNSNLIDASGLEMPAMTLAYGCYSGMFHSCFALTTTPALPATTLATSCYIAMFNNCSALVDIPTLPATTLAPRCYQAMFQDCTSLTDIPTLPATVMKNYCYLRMFQNCTSLTDIPAGALPATTLGEDCYANMFNGCTALTTVPELPATEMAPGCYSNMFVGCTSLTSIRQLPEQATPTTVMAESCWESMFENCSGINDTVIIHAKVLATKSCRRMFQGCSSLTSVSFRLATDISAMDALDQWLQNTAVGTTGTLYVLSSTLKQWKNDGEVPNNWSIQPI